MYTRIWRSIFTVELVKTVFETFSNALCCCVSNNSKLLVENRSCFASILFSFLFYGFFEKFSNFPFYFSEKKKCIYGDLFSL